MSTTYEQLRDAVLKLPDAERAALYSELADSFEAPESEAELDDEWGDEVARRVEEIDSGKAILYDSEVIRKEIRAMLAKAKKAQGICDQAEA